MDKTDNIFSDPAYDLSQASLPRRNNRNSMVVKTSSLDILSSSEGKGRSSFMQRSRPSSQMEIDTAPILNVEELTEAEENRIANEMYG